MRIFGALFFSTECDLALIEVFNIVIDAVVVVVVVVVVVAVVFVVHLFCLGSAGKSAIHIQTPCHTITPKSREDRLRGVIRGTESSGESLVCQTAPRYF